MSLDDLPTRTPPSGAEAETPVRRVDRPSPLRDNVPRAEELRLQLADEIVGGVLAPGAALFGSAHAGARCAPSTCGEWPGRIPRPSRRGRGPALARPADRNVRGDGG